MPESSEVNLIDVTSITPSPYQPRQKIRDIEGLADSIKDIGLIEPISVRVKGEVYELIVGERRWRAAQLAGLSEILAVVRDISDSQARQMTLAENVIREDLSPIEMVIAWAEHVDAEMWGEGEYRELTAAAGWPDEFDRPQARQRARWLLRKLDSDRRRQTDYVSHKFVGQVQSVFARHPKRLEWRSFFSHDIPLLDLPEPAQELAIDKSLNKSQSKALGELAKKHKGEFENVVQSGLVLTEDNFEFEEVPIEEASSREIKSSGKTRRKKNQREELLDLKESRSRDVIDTDSQVWLGDFKEIGQRIPDDSVDLIFTDPPYARVDLYGALAEFGKRALRPGGLCLAYSGEYHLPQIFEVLAEHLQYLWTCAIWHTGGEQQFIPLKIRIGWKPILAFYKPPKTVWWDWFSDATSGGKDKRFHDWQQSEAEAAHYLTSLCPAGGLVVDPMCGTGTTLIAAKKLGLQYIGIDEDISQVRVAQARLGNG